METFMPEDRSADFIPDRACVAAEDAQIPVIDISPFLRGHGRRGVIDAVAAACEQVGFFVVTGHGVPDRTVDSIYRHGRAFFEQPVEQKMAIKRPAPGVSRGYNSLSDQSLGATLGVAAPPDLQESFAIGPLDIGEGPYWNGEFGRVHFYPNLWPASPAEFRPAVTAYYRAMEQLSMALSRIFALALELDEEFFLDKIDRHVSTMRLNFYPRQVRPPAPGQIRAGAHSDYGAFTILKTEAAPGGLQVMRRRNDWIDVPVVPGGFVINIGDLFMRWTNDRWVSTLHRVVNPPEDTRANSTRMSVAFFLVANHDAEVRCLESCTGPANPPRYPATTAGAHWRAKILAARQVRSAAPVS
jgi:isopenicillin N synthase-like dioxygenase